MTTNRKEAETRNEKAPTSLEANGAPQDSNQTEVQKENDKMNNNTDKQTNQSESNEGTGVSGSIDLSRLRMSQDFDQIAGVKKKIITIPVRKPNRQDFIRVHPDDNYAFQTATLEIKEEREIYIVDHPLWSELSGEIVPMILLTATNRQGVLTLWPIRLPDSNGRTDNWNHSALEASLLAREQWVRIAANMSLGSYEVFTATGELPEPDWPDLSFQEIMDIAFKGKFITDLDHAAIRRLRGAL